MASHDIVVIGASAGGVPALRELAGGLPGDLPAAVFVVVHVSPDSTPFLHEILSRAGPLPAMLAEEGMPVRYGRIVVARPDHHLLLEPDRIRVVRGPRENRSRPAIDPLFRSAAWTYGARVVGVVLTGNLSDGAAGLSAIKRCGGTTIVQDPRDSANPEMPSAALAHSRVDHCLPLASIAPRILSLSQTEASAVPDPAGARIGLEVDMDTGKRILRPLENMDRLARRSPFTCPACGGALWELDDNAELRYRCHTGHAFSAHALLEGQSDEVEQSLYTALRAVQEKAAALRRLSDRWPADMPALKVQYQDRAAELDHTADVLRRLLTGGMSRPSEPGA